MYALCVSGAVNTQGFVWKFFYALYINFHSFIHSFERFICLDLAYLNASIKPFYLVKNQGLNKKKKNNKQKK